jgi:hypothetical protein
VPAIVTAKRGKRITAAPGVTPPASPEIKAFFARMIRPPVQWAAVPRLVPRPWTVTRTPGGWMVIDANGFAVAYT